MNDGSGRIYFINKDQTCNMRNTINRTIVNPLFMDTAMFLETSAETGGYHSLLEFTLQPGGKNFSHVHRDFTETFIAVRGILGLQLADETVLLKPGDSFVVLKNEVHNFFNPGKEELLFRIKLSPGHEGMENALRIAYGLARDGRTNKKGIPRNIYEMALLMEMSDSYSKRIASVIKPLFSLLAKRAKRKGTEKLLMDKYCK
jgi:mannose-6-phosphate isomerase-like protein (cupin superfamily)